MTTTDYRPPDAIPPIVAARLAEAGRTATRITEQATAAAPRPGPRTDVRATLTAAMERLLAHIDRGRAESARAALEVLEGIARDAIAARVAQTAEPAAGGHYWYEPTGGGPHRCTQCTVRASTMVIEHGVVPVCGTTGRCPLVWHELYLDRVDGHPAGCCIFCDLTVTAPAGSAS